MQPQTHKYNNLGRIQTSKMRCALVPIGEAFDWMQIELVENYSCDHNSWKMLLCNCGDCHLEAVACSTNSVGQMACFVLTMYGSGEGPFSVQQLNSLVDSISQWWPQTEAKVGNRYDFCLWAAGYIQPQRSQRFPHTPHTFPSGQAGPYHYSSTHSSQPKSIKENTEQGQ